MTTSKSTNLKHGHQMPKIKFGADWKGTFMITGEFVIRNEELVKSAHDLLRSKPSKKGKPASEKRKSKSLNIRA
jgi:hypothetical protein